MLRKLILLSTIAAAVAAAPARAAWQPPVAIPTGQADSGLPPALAVADNGRAAAIAQGIVPSVISRGRRATVLRSDRLHSRLVVQGRRPLALGHGDVVRMEVGSDGTIALLMVDEKRLLLRTVSPHGRLGAARVLGQLGWMRSRNTAFGGVMENPFLAVDARGHAHVAWNQPSGVMVAGSHGRRRLPGSVRAFAISPGGATAVALAYDDALHVAIDTRG
jgi:hypothetical protein